MQTLADIRAAVRLAVDDFNQRHRLDPYAKCYLWFHATRPEMDGGIQAFGEDIENPRNVTANQDIAWELVSPQGFRGMSGEDVAQLLTVTRVLSALPVLSLVA